MTTSDDIGVTEVDFLVAGSFVAHRHRGPLRGRCSRIARCAPRFRARPRSGARGPVRRRAAAGAIGQHPRMQVGRAAAALLAVLDAAAIGCGGEEPNAAGRAGAARSASSPTSSSCSPTTRTSPPTRRARCRSRSGCSATGASPSPTRTTPPRCAVPRGRPISPASTGTTTGCSTTSPATATLDDNDNVLGVWLQRAGYHDRLRGQVPQRLRELRRGQGRGRARLGPLVDPGRQRPRLLRASSSPSTASSARRSTTASTSPTCSTTVRPSCVASSPAEAPFFLQLGHAAPHNENINADSGGPCGGGAVPPRRDLGRFAGEPLPNLPAVLRARRLRQARLRRRPASSRRRQATRARAIATSAGSRPCRRSTAGSPSSSTPCARPASSTRP